MSLERIKITDSEGTLKAIEANMSSMYVTEGMHRFVISFTHPGYAKGVLEEFDVDAVDLTWAKEAGNEYLKTVLSPGFKLHKVERVYTTLY